MAEDEDREDDRGARGVTRKSSSRRRRDQSLHSRLIGYALHAPEPLNLAEIAARRAELAEIFRPRPIALLVRRIVRSARWEPLKNERIAIAPGDHP